MKKILLLALTVCFILVGCSSPSSSSPTTTTLPFTASPTKSIITPSATSTPIVSISDTPEPTPIYTDINWDDYICWDIYCGHVANGYDVGFLTLMVPKNDTEDIRCCLFERKEDDASAHFSQERYNLSDALYIFPDVRENNAYIGKLKNIYSFELTDITGDGLTDFYFVGMYERDGVLYYDTRIYIRCTNAQGIQYEPAYEYMERLNEIYTRVDEKEYPMEEILGLYTVPTPTETPVSIQKFLPEEVAVIPEVPLLDFEDAKNYGIYQEIHGILPGASTGTWYTIRAYGIEYYYALYDHNKREEQLFGYSIIDEQHVLNNGLAVGMTVEEVLQLYPNIVAIDFEDNYVFREGTRFIGWNFTAYPHSYIGEDDTYAYNDKDFYWHNQFDFLLIADVVQPDTLPIYLGLLVKDNEVTAITFYYPTAS